MLVLTIVRSSLAVVSYISKSVGDLVVAVVVGMVTGMVVGMVVKTVVGVVVGTLGDVGSSTLTFRGTVVVDVVVGEVVGMVVESVVGVVVGSSTLTFRGTVVTSLLAVICSPEPHPGVVQVAPINTAPGSPQTDPPDASTDDISPFLMLSVHLQGGVTQCNYNTDRLYVKRKHFTLLCAMCDPPRGENHSMQYCQP